MSLNATIGSENANSYVTVEEANAYFADRVHSEAWTAFSNKESVLSTASQMLDWYITWKGYKTNSEQAMQWPRTGVVRKNGRSVASGIIPRDVKVATYELALSSLGGDRTSDSDMAGIVQVKAGSLMVKSDNGSKSPTSPEVIPEKIWKILSDLYSRGNLSVIRLMRA